VHPVLMLMDTYEARTRMCDIGRGALTIALELSSGAAPTTADKANLRRMLLEARSLLADAGYPGEAVWRALHRSSIGADTTLDQPDASYWQDVAGSLEAGIATLESLISSHPARETDFRVIG
jgi:hypothetical protein